MRAVGLAGLACAALAGAGPAVATVAQAPASPALPEEANLGYFVGAWDIMAVTPGTGESARFSYEVRPLVSTTWLSGRGRSEELGLESSDVWGRDSASGEVMRVIFDGSGTYAVVKSFGWRGDSLVLEGDARSASGVVRVRETITRLGPDTFTATWEAYRNGAWSAYSVERATRRAAPEGRS